jgi:hypothetical protein
LVATPANSQVAVIVPAAALELELVPVVAEPERGQVVAGLELVLVAAEPEVVRAAVERERGQAVAALERDQALELELVPVVAEPERGQAVAALERVPAAELGHRHAHQGALPRTKSATAAHHRDRVLRHVAGEDLAVAAEITREPVAAEAVVAWAVAE